MKILVVLILLALIYFIYKKYFAGDKHSNGQDSPIGSEGQAPNIENQASTESEISASGSDSSAIDESADHSNSGTTAAKLAATAAGVAGVAAASTGAENQATTMDRATSSQPDVGGTDGDVLSNSPNNASHSGSGPTDESSSAADAGISTESKPEHASAASTASAGASTTTAASSASSGGIADQGVEFDFPIEHLVGIDRRTGKALRAHGIADTGDIVGASLEQLQAAGINMATAKTLQAQAALSGLPGATPDEASVLASCGINSLQSLAEQDPEKLASRLTHVNRLTGTLKSSPGVQKIQRMINSAKAAA